MKEKIYWKKTLILLMCMGLVLGGTYSYLSMDFKREMISPVIWKSFSPIDERFDIKFPLDPRESHEEMKVANKRVDFHQFSAEHGDAIYAVSYLDFPSHWKLLGTQKLLKKSFDMWMENEPTIQRVLHHKLGSHRGIPALEYQVKQRGGGQMRGKFIIAGNTLYRVAVTSPLAAAGSVESKEFIDSFSVRG